VKEELQHQAEEKDLLHLEGVESSSLTKGRNYSGGGRKCDSDVTREESEQTMAHRL